jgi:iron complex outermembrane recepter protein
MNQNRTYLRKRSWRLTALTGVGALLLTTPMLAQSTGQQTDSEETVKLEKFVVTGSMIPIAADTPAIPVTVMTSADIAKTGVTSDLTDVLKKTQPYFYGRGNLGAENANTRSGSTAGASTLSLRNRATLILINGRRAALSPTAAVGGGNFVDVSLIPPSAVERIEILSDGASALYGTDAVSGVINIILKTSYRGAEIGGTFGWAPEASDWSSRSAYVTAGGGTDRTQVTISAEWRRTDPLFQYERPWGLNQFRTPTFAGVINPNASDFYHLNPSLNAPPQNLDLTMAELVAAGIYAGPFTQDQVTRFFDLSEWSTMLLSSERQTLSVAVEHRWTDNITAFADILASHSYTRSTLNAQPVSGNVAANNPNNPANIQVTARNRFRAFPRLYKNDTLGMRGVFGLRGSIEGTSWIWEVGTGINRTTLAFRNENLIDAAAYTAAVTSGTYNPFARIQAPGVIEGFLGTGSRDYVSRLYSFDFRASGELFNLPGGPVQGGFGLESRLEKVQMNNDRNDQTGGWLQATPTNPFSAKQDVDALFAELRVPVFGGGNARPGFNTFEIGVAARKEIYSSTTDPFVPKYTLRWLPFNDELAFRGTYSESFSAPTLFSLFGPRNSGFTNSINIQRYDANGNPLGPTGQRQYRSRGGSNPNLIPSESRNWTAGVVWSPRNIRGLSLSVDWFNIDERNLVGNIPQAILLQSVEQFGPASPYAHQVRLGTSVAGESHFDTGSPITAPGQVTSGASDAVWMTNPAINIAGVWQSGADIRLDYRHETKTMGRFDFSVAGTYLNEYVIQNLPTTAPADVSGGFNGSTYPRFRTFTQVDWAYNNWTAGLSHTYIPSVTDFLAAVTADTDAYHSVDLRFGYTFKDSGNRLLEGLRVTFGVNNVFSEDPPLMLGEQDQGRDINTFDPLGRYYYVSFRYKF